MMRDPVQVDEPPIHSQALDSPSSLVDTQHDAPTRISRSREAPSARVAPSAAEQIAQSPFFSSFASRRLPPHVRIEGGKPQRLTDEVARIICGAIAVHGMSRRAAAALVRVDETLLSRWMHYDHEPYVTFQAWVHEAKAIWIMQMTNSSLTPAKLADKPEIALKMLERRAGEDYRPPRNDANVNVNLDVTAILSTIEQRKREPFDPRRRIIEGQATRLPDRDPVNNHVEEGQP